MQIGLNNFYKLPSELKEIIINNIVLQVMEHPHTIEEVYQMLYANKIFKDGKTNKI